jgi:hypothetical protein
MVMPRQLDSCFRSNVAAWWCRTCLCCHDGPRFCFFVVWPRHPWCCSDSQQRVQIIASAGPLSTSSWPGAMPWAGWSQAKSDDRRLDKQGLMLSTQLRSVAGMLLPGPPRCLCAHRRPQHHGPAQLIKDERLWHQLFPINSQGLSVVR